jgi:2-methylcitrate dehydratase PrpD
VTSTPTSDDGLVEVLVDHADLSPTRVLADFASALEFPSIPPVTIAQAKLSILDTLGCAIYGSTLPWVTMLRRFVMSEGGKPVATLWGSSLLTSATQAALVNSTAAHSFEFDDIHMGGMIHPGALTLGAALAVGECRGLDGRTVLAAIVAGCEVGARVGMAVGTPHFRAGYHPQGTVGVFAASATAGRAMGLDPSRMREAIGIAGTQAAGLMAAQEGSMAKRLHSGLACQSGVRSALLAAEGFTGIPNVLEADFGGFCGTMGGGHVDMQRLTADLGSRWETDRIGFKPYASCAAAQSSIDVARRIRDGARLSGPDVGSVTVTTSTHAKIHCGWEFRPTGVTAAQMSIPYGVACALEHGNVTAANFTEEAIRAESTVSLARRVTVVADEGIDSLGPDQRYTVRVEVRTVDGRLLTGEATDRPGGPTRPLSARAVEEKFLGLASPVLGGRAAQLLREVVDEFDRLDDVRTLLPMLVPG